MIEILIPTFNREKDINKNLNLLIKQINDDKLENLIKISVSDNHSSDNTVEIVQNIIKNTNLKINLYEQTENIGLEKNAVFLLEKSTDKFIMYLGDDDFLPVGYLKYLINQVYSIDNLTCVIPGFSALYSDGSIQPARHASFNEKKYLPSFKTVQQVSQFGHQLSGLLLKREDLYENYTDDKKLRNIYLFIYFVAYNNLKGTTIYAPMYQVLVSQGNSKDWAYDDSGLLTEIFKNYKIVFKNSYIKRNIMNFVFMNQQSWRLRIGKNLKNAYKSFVHIEKDEDVDLLTKLLLPIFYVYLYTRTVASKVKRIIFK